MVVFNEGIKGLEKEEKEEDSYLQYWLPFGTPPAIVASSVMESTIAISFIPTVTFVT
jgi:hypothetical protein